MEEQNIGVTAHAQVAKKVNKNQRGRRIALVRGIENKGQRVFRLGPAQEGEQVR
ncbi:MAG TPA: hypothetical protein VFA91_09580 [Candidatus Polarisedimenticolia bacterium]|nr:hypothetical protein [Candidatus Polarisedimenticolia bacterium]